jgi:formylmethanofuran dehydrogenase subunit E
MKKSIRFTRNLLKSATSFHGHLGPYLVLGLRMGLLANKTLQPRGVHDISATVWTKQSPPESCLLDGIQVSSGCTLGKTNLRVKNASRIRARFRKGNRSLLIKPTEETAKLLRSISGRTTKKEVEELAVSLSSMPERALFAVKRGMHTSLPARTQISQNDS